MRNLQTGDSILNRAHAGLRSAAGITIGLSILTAVLATLDKGSYVLVNTIVTGGMWALMSMGLALVFGVMNIPNFASRHHWILRSCSGNGSGGDCFSRA